jgi:hypothetical protein
MNVMMESRGNFTASLPGNRRRNLNQAAEMISLCPMMKRPRRHPVIQIVLIALVCLLGIGSRRFAHVLPWFVGAYAGDTLWAMAVFLGIGLVLPRASTRTIACLAMTLSVAVEISQLYHAPWIDSIRQTTLGGLILGFGFLWSDLACYAVGVGIGALVEWFGEIAPGEDRR